MFEGDSSSLFFARLFRLCHRSGGNKLIWFWWNSWEHDQMRNIFHACHWSVFVRSKLSRLPRRGTFVLRLLWVVFKWQLDWNAQIAWRCKTVAERRRCELPGRGGVNPRSRHVRVVMCGRRHRRRRDSSCSIEAATAQPVGFRVHKRWHAANTPEKAFGLTPYLDVCPHQVDVLVWGWQTHMKRW